MANSQIKYIDLFAGIGGMRIAFEQRCHILGFTPECVFTSEIKKHAIKIYKDNFPESEINGDISKISTEDLPDFDVLLAGFPCQPFSTAGNRLGFSDTRGTLFFEIERILEDKRPSGFILENVEGLVKHQRKKGDKTGRTMKVILESLEAIGYKVTWEVLDAQDFGLPQQRRRVYICGTLKTEVDLDDFPESKAKLHQIFESGKPLETSDFATAMMSYCGIDNLHGKVMNDKRGGSNNIHSWDLGFKGETTVKQQYLMTELIKQRRHRSWAIKKGIGWVDGTPLTPEDMSTYLDETVEDIRRMCEDLRIKGYLFLKHPREKKVTVDEQGNESSTITLATHIEKGYAPYSGRLSFPINRILDPQGISPTLVATDGKLFALVDGDGIRKLTAREGLRMFGYPESYFIEGISHDKCFDLLGNTVAVNVVESVSGRLLLAMTEGEFDAI